MMRFRASRPSTILLFYQTLSIEAILKESLESVFEWGMFGGARSKTKTNTLLPYSEQRAVFTRGKVQSLPPHLQSERA